MKMHPGAERSARPRPARSPWPLLLSILVLAILWPGARLRSAEPSPTPRDAASLKPPPRDAASLKRAFEAGALKQLGEAEFRKLMIDADPGALLGAALLRLRDHPRYTYTLTKLERIKGELQREGDTIRFQFQRDPLALCAIWTAGPHKGRRVVYNHTARPGELLVKEGGLLGLMSLHLRLDNSLTRRDTNHSLLETGLEYPLQRSLQDLKLLQARGQTPDPAKGKWVVEGGRRYWEVITETAGPPTFYAHWAKLRFDLESGLLVGVETRDAKRQLVEQLRFMDIRWTPIPARTFDPSGKGCGM